MMDLEKRVRSTLHTLADSVPPSTDPRADLERRLAVRRPGRGLGRRRPVTRPTLLAAAAAVVVIAVAGVVIPLATHRDPVERPATPPGDGLVWSSDYAWVDAETGPHVLGTFERDGETVDAVAWLRGGELCVGEGHHVAVGSSGQAPAALVGVSCEQLPTAWPTGSGPGSMVVTRPVLGGEAIHSGPVPGLLLFLTAPQVATLDVRSGDGSPVAVRGLGAAGGSRLFLADFGAAPWGFGYTAKDSEGGVVESAIT